MSESTSDKKFRSRVLAMQERHDKNVAAALVASHFRPERLMVLEDYLQTSRKRREVPFPLLRLQLNLLQDLLTAQSSIAKGKQLLSEAQTETGSREQGLAEVTQREIDFCEMQRRVIRDIGDGIAWRTFNYDRVALYTLADRPAVNHIEAEGLASELRALADAVDASGGVGIINCVTNVLRHADVTIRHSPDEFEFLEVKTGHKSSGRISRQKKALRRTLELLNTGTEGGGDAKRMIADLDVRIETFAPEIDSLLTQAETEGVVFDKLDDCLIVEVSDGRRASELGPVLVKEQWAKGEKLIESWRALGDHVSSLTSQDRYVSAKSYAPFSIYPFSDERCIGLASGRLMIVGHVNLSGLVRAFENHGWNSGGTVEEHLARGQTGHRLDAPLATLTKGDFTIELPAGPIARIALEFLRPDSLVEMFDALYTLRPTDAGAGLTSVREEHLWW